MIHVGWTRPHLPAGVVVRTDHKFDDIIHHNVYIYNCMVHIHVVSLLGHNIPGQRVIGTGLVGTPRDCVVNIVYSVDILING